MHPVRLCFALLVATCASGGLRAAPVAAEQSRTSIYARLLASGEHRAFVSLIDAAGLAGTLSAKGDVTVFAPTDVGFAKLAPGSMAILLLPANKAQLVTVVRYHLVAGTMTTATIRTRIAAGGGRAVIPTLQGEALTATEVGGRIVLADVKGGSATVIKGDLRQANGIIHVTDAVSKGHHDPMTLPPSP